MHCQQNWTFRHSRYFRQRAKCWREARPTMDWGSDQAPSSRAEPPERRRSRGDLVLPMQQQNRSLRFAPVGMTDVPSARQRSVAQTTVLDNNYSDLTIPFGLV